MLPPLGSLQFVRMDSSRSMARALYRWPREDMVRYTVIVYRNEEGEWKIDSIVVKTDIVSDPRQAQIMEEVLRRAAAAQPAN
jgi:spore coat polysaccharide biosynthesis protein SpsF (cytidylyltransferase family)